MGMFDDLIPSSGTSTADYGMFSDLVPKPPPARTWGEAAADTGLGLASGAAGLVKTAGELGGLITGNMDNAVSTAGDDAQKYLESKQSDALKAKRTARQEKIDAADTMLGKFATAIYETITDPALMGDTVASNAATMLPGMAVGRAVYGANLGRGILAASEMGPASLAARAAVAEGAAKIGTGAAVGVGAVQQGADVSDQAYEQSMKKTAEELANNPQFTAGVDAKLADGMVLEDAILATKKELSTSAARGSFLPAAAISVAANAIPGGTMLERALIGGAARDTIKAGAKYGLLKSIAKAGLGEAAQETLEEGGGQFAANVATKNYVDPSHDLETDVGVNAGLGFVGGLGMGVPGGAMHRQGHANEPEPITKGVADIAAAPTVDDAIAAAAQSVSAAPSISDRVDALKAELSDRAVMESLIATFGDDGTTQFLNSLTQAGDKTVPMSTREKHLQSVEDALFAMRTTRIDPTLAIGSEQPALLGHDTATESTQAAQEQPTEPTQPESGPPGVIPTGMRSEPEAGMAPRTSTAEPTFIDPVHAPNAVKAYVDKQRSINTPMAHAFVQAFDSGRITSADVASLIAPRQTETVNDRLAAAAAQGKKLTPLADRLDAYRKTTTDEPSSIVVERSGARRSSEPERSGTATPNLAQDATGRNVASPAEPVQSGASVVPAGVAGANEALSGRVAGAGPTKSWVIREKATGNVVMETFDRKKVDALNTAKYEAVPVAQHIAQLNAKSKAAAPQDQTTAPATPVGDAQTNQTASAHQGEPAQTDASVEAFIRKATNAERLNNATRQRAMRSMPEREGRTAVFMPYGAQGAGFYYAPNRTDAPKQPPKSFRAKHAVTTPVFVEETGKFEPREVDADSAVKALNEDISELQAFLKCIGA